MTVKVTLTWSEMLFAANAAVMRQIQNMKLGRRDRFGCSEDDGWSVHIEGACGELAVAKATNQFWSGSLGNLDADDVGRLQVRTRSKSHYDLIIHPTDKDERKYVLVTGKAPAFEVHGWILGVEGKQQKYWKDPAGGRPAFFVAKSDLNSIESLLI